MSEDAVLVLKHQSSCCWKISSRARRGFLPSIVVIRCDMGGQVTYLDRADLSVELGARGLSRERRPCHGMKKSARSAHSARN